MRVSGTGTSRVRRSAALLVAAAVVAGAGVAGGVAPVSAAEDSRAGGEFRADWWMKWMEIPAAHRQATGKGVTIAVLDDGLDLSQPQLRGADIRMMRSPCLGFNQQFRDRRAVPEKGEAAFHGTAMVSLLVGNGVGTDGPGSGMLGMVPDATILFYDLESSSRPGYACDQNDEASSIDAAQRRADVLSISWTRNGSAIMDSAANAVEKNRAVVVAAMPNPPKRALAAPAAMPGVVGMTSVNRQGDPRPGIYAAKDMDPDSAYPLWFQPKFAGPGDDILVPNTDGLPSSEDGRWWGSSFATPMVAGQVAMVREKYPDATANQVVQHLLHNTARAGSEKEKLTWYETGFGLPDTSALLANDPTVWPDENPFMKGPDRMWKRYPSSIATDPAEAEASRAEPTESARQPASDARAEEATEAEQAGEGSVVPWLLGGGVAVLAVAAGVVVLLRRRAQR